MTGNFKSYSSFCDPAGAQTQNLQNRNLTLYSIELRGLRIMRLLSPASSQKDEDVIYQCS